MQYRLAYRNAAEVSAFATSRWAATPADMLRKQLLRAAHEGAGKCTLDIEIQEFSQVFSAQEASEAQDRPARGVARRAAPVRGASSSRMPARMP